MTLRTAKVLLVLGVAFFYSLVVLNNLTDYDSNYQYVRHVLTMDTTYLDGHTMWRAVHRPAIHTAFYVSIIAWEIATMILCWAGGLKLAGALRQSPAVFQAKKRWAVIALTSSLLMWLIAFLSVGAEWFLMWQSKTWDGREEGFRMFTVVGIVLLLVAQRDTNEQP